MATSLLRRVGVGVLASLLVVTLVSANVAVGVDRTVLDADFVTETLDEADAYSVATEVMRSTIAEQASGPEPDDGSGDDQMDSGSLDDPSMPNMDAIAEAVITESYVQTQVESNVQNLYDYLHGRESELVLEVDLVPVKETLVSEMSTMFVEDLSTVDPTLAAMTESEAAFEAEREAFEAEQKERIQEETEEELSDEELQARYDELRPEIREELLSMAADQTTGDEEVPPELEDAMLTLVEVRVDALVAEDATYDSFMADLDDAKAEFAAAAEPVIAAEIDEEMPDRMSLIDEMDAQTREQFELAQRGVAIVGTLTYLLPVLALALAGIIHWATRRRSSGLLVVGGATALTGLGFVAGLTLGEQRVTAEVNAMVAEGAIPAELASIVLGVLTRTMAVFTTQSWVLLGLGTVLVLGGVGIRQGVLPVTDVPDATAAAGSTPETEASGTSDTDGVRMDEATGEGAAGEDAADLEGDASAVDEQDGSTDQNGSTDPDEPDGSDDDVDPASGVDAGDDESSSA